MFESISLLILLIRISVFIHLIVFYPVGSCVSPTSKPTAAFLEKCKAYQQTVVTAEVVFGGNGLSDQSVYVTDLVTFKSDSPSVASVGNHNIVYGQSVGEAEISVDVPTDLVVMSDTITVSDTPVKIESLSVSAVTGSTSPDTTVAGDELSVTSSFTLYQNLTHEGATAIISVYANFDDGTYQDITESADVSALSPYVSTASGSMDGLPYLTVEKGAATSRGQFIQALYKPNLMCFPNATINGTGTVVLELPDVTGMMFTSSVSVISPSADEASTSPFNIPVHATLSFSVMFADGTTKSFSSPFDNRALVTVISGTDLVSITNDVRVVAKPTAVNGTATIKVTFPGLYALEGTVTIDVVLFARSVLSASSYPSTPNLPGKSDLYTIGCSGVYQRSRLSSVGVLTNGLVRDITAHSTFVSGNPLVGVFESSSSSVFTPLAPGSVNARSLFRTKLTPWFTYTIHGSAVNVTAIAFTNVPYTVSGTAEQAFPSNVRVEFSDGTIIGNIMGAPTNAWLHADQVVTFDSDRDDVISIDSSGVITLHGNYYTTSTLRVTERCSGEVEGSRQVYTNLLPEAYDVDMGYSAGAPFGTVHKGDSFDVSIRLRGKGTHDIVAWQILLMFNASRLQVQDDTRCAIGRDWAASFECTTNNPVNRVIMAGSCGLSPSSLCGTTGLIEVATVRFTALEAGSLTQITGVLVRLVDDTDAFIVNQPIFAGTDNLLIVDSGRRMEDVPFFDISGAPSRFADIWEPRLAFANKHQAELHRDNALQISAPRDARVLSQCSCVHGDTNGDCFFDVSDVANLQYFVGGLYSASNTSACQMVGMDPDHNGVVDGVDIQYLLRVVTRKYRFLESLSVDVGAGTLTLSSLVLDEAGSRAVDVEPLQTVVAYDLMALGYSMDEWVVSEGSNAAHSAHGLSTVSAGVPVGGNETHVARLERTTDIPAVEVAIILTTYDALGTTANNRQFVFYCSPLLSYCTDLYGMDPEDSFRPYFKFESHRGVGTAVPTNLPSHAPSAAPTFEPTVAPSAVPSALPSVSPSESPSFEPSALPSAVPSAEPSVVGATLNPTAVPSSVEPTVTPTVAPSAVPTALPTYRICPTGYHGDPFGGCTQNSVSPSASPTVVPSVDGATLTPSAVPTASPTVVPSVVGATLAPTAAPTVAPTCAERFYYDGVSCQACDPACFTCDGPTANDCIIYTCPDGLFNDHVIGDCQFCHDACPSGPCNGPTADDCLYPTVTPTVAPSAVPTALPTYRICPTGYHGDPFGGCTQNSVSPSASPTVVPSVDGATLTPSAVPTASPTVVPSVVGATLAPTAAPTVAPTCAERFYYDGVSCQACDPACFTCDGPTANDCIIYTCPDGLFNDHVIGDCQFCHDACPSGPCNGPTADDCLYPTVTPTVAPSAEPSALPSVSPTESPSFEPSALSSAVPSAEPSVVGATLNPTAVPSSGEPTVTPTVAPSGLPSALPSISPSVALSFYSQLHPEIYDAGGVSFPALDFGVVSGKSQWSTGLAGLFGNSPGSSGHVGIKVAGRPYGEQEYQIARKPVHNIRFVVQTAVVYEDTRSISVAYQVADIYGHTQVAAPGASETYVLTVSARRNFNISGIATGDDDLYSVSCELPDAVSGIGSCVGDISVSWFSFDVDTVVYASVALVGDFAVVESERDECLLKRREQDTELDLSRINVVFSLPVSSVESGASFTVPVTAISLGEVVETWGLLVEYDNSVLSLVSAASGENFRELDVSGRASGDPSRSSVYLGSSGLLGGTDIDAIQNEDTTQLGDLTFLVNPTNFVGSVSSVVSVFVQTMIKIDAHPAIPLEGIEARSVGSRALVISGKVYAGLLAYSEHNELINTAVITGDSVLSPIIVVAIRSGVEFVPEVITPSFCVVDDAYMSAISVLSPSPTNGTMIAADRDNCVVKLSSTNSDGSRSVHVGVVYDSRNRVPVVNSHANQRYLNVSVPLRIWYPTLVSVRVKDPILNRIN